VADTCGGTVKNLPTRPYLEQTGLWPREGRHILGHFDEESIVVYQAYRPSIGRYAIEHRAFGGPDFSFSRMSWIKPNFLWMMYRSGWGTKEGQECSLGVRIRRAFFDRILVQAVPSTYAVERYETRDAWQVALASSRRPVAVGPRPRHPAGEKVARRAIQLGLRGDVLHAFATTETLDVIDMTAFVAEQRAFSARDRWPQLQTPEERVYRPLDPAAADNAGLDAV
jgi:hypothetical protein